MNGKEKDGYILRALKKAKTYDEYPTPPKETADKNYGEIEDRPRITLRHQAPGAIGTYLAYDPGYIAVHELGHIGAAKMLDLEADYDSAELGGGPIAEALERKKIFADNDDSCEWANGCVPTEGSGSELLDTLVLSGGFLGTTLWGLGIGYLGKRATSPMMKMNATTFSALQVGHVLKDLYYKIEDSDLYRASDMMDVSPELASIPVFLSSAAIMATTWWDNIKYGVNKYVRRKRE